MNKKKYIFLTQTLVVCACVCVFDCVATFILSLGNSFSFFILFSFFFASHSLWVFVSLSVCVCLVKLRYMKAAWQSSWRICADCQSAVCVWAVNCDECIRATCQKWKHRNRRCEDSRAQNTVIRQTKHIKNKTRDASLNEKLFEPDIDSNEMNSLSKVSCVDGLEFGEPHNFFSVLFRVYSSSEMDWMANWRVANENRSKLHPILVSRHGIGMLNSRIHGKLFNPKLM